MQIIRMVDIVVPKGNKQPDKQYQTLLAHVRTHGILIPICVIKVGRKYKIVDGLLRYYASLDCRYTDIPAEVATMAATTTYTPKMD